MEGPMSPAARAHSAETEPGSACPAVRRFVATAALAVALSGCAADRVVTGSTEAPDYHARHPIVLTEGARTLDVFVTGYGGLDSRQREDLRTFAAEYRRSGQGAILAQVPAGTRNDAAAHATMARINEALADGGLPAGNMAGDTH